VSATWSVEDNLALDRVELWRALYAAADCNDTIKTGCNWGSVPVSGKTVAGTTSNGNFSDIPAPGTYWYGLHAVDAAGNIAVENQPIKAILITMPLIKINMFTAAVNSGDSSLIDIAWSVEDPADYLERIEIWSTTDYRGAPNSSGWQKITSLTVDLSASSLKSHNGSATHAPASAVYWYGLHAINKKGTCVTEGNTALFVAIGNGLSRMGPDRVVMPLPGDVLSPVVDAYDINPKTVAPGENYTLTWSASDDAGLAWIELSSSPDMGGAPDPTQWTKKGTLGTSGTIATGTVTLTATTTASVWWLALKAIDTTGKIGSEPDPPGPIMVTAGP
jgi:hypothetical protein